MSFSVAGRGQPWLISPLIFSALLVPTLAGTVSAGERGERGTAEARLGGGRIRVEYGRPRLSGRTLPELLSQLPEDRIWRAGSNDVTTLTTEVRLRLGAQEVAPGTYSVYVHAPEKGSWSLILNADLGIPLGSLGKALGFPVPPLDAGRRWPHLEGYASGNPAKGLPAIAPMEAARAPLVEAAALRPSDALTISLTPTPGGATMTLAWGDRSWSVALTQ